MICLFTSSPPVTLPFSPFQPKILYISHLRPILPRPVIPTPHAERPGPHLLAPPPPLFNHQRSQFPSLDTAGIQAFGVFGDGKTAAGVMAVDDSLAMAFGEEGLVFVPELW